MDYPQYAEVDNEKYKINTDFRVAIECNEIAQNKKIGDYERALAIIFKLYGEKGLSAFEKHDKLLKIALKYLTCGKDLSDGNDEIDMDYSQDFPYIEASFQSDYGISLEDTQMHWWKFYNLLCGLSNSELGNCCILNRIRNLRTYDISNIKDEKLKEKYRKAKKEFALNKNKKENNLTKEQEESMRMFNKQARL